MADKCSHFKFLQHLLEITSSQYFYVCSISSIEIHVSLYVIDFFYSWVSDQDHCHDQLFPFCFAAVSGVDRSSNGHHGQSGQSLKEEKGEFKPCAHWGTVPPMPAKCLSTYSSPHVKLTAELISITEPWMDSIWGQIIPLCSLFTHPRATLHPRVLHAALVLWQVSWPPISIHWHKCRSSQFEFWCQSLYSGLDFLLPFASNFVSCIYWASPLCPGWIPCASSVCHSKPPVPAMSCFSCVQSVLINSNSEVTNEYFEFPVVWIIVISWSLDMWREQKSDWTWDNHSTHQSSSYQVLTVGY